MHSYSHLLTIFLLCIHFFGHTQSHEFRKDHRQTFTFADTLQLDYYPAMAQDSHRNSVLVLLIHGGGFATGRRDGKAETKWAQSMSELGYHVASMSYHLTRKGKGFGCDCKDEEKIMTFDQSASDIDAALTFLDSLLPKTAPEIAHRVLMGSSAGAEAALHYQFQYESSRRKSGGLSGLISLAGATLDTASINRDNVIPTLLIHGTDDLLVPYRTAPHHFCQKDTPGYLMLSGSASIAGKLEKLGTPFWLLTVNGGGHEWSSLGYEEIDLTDAFLLGVSGKNLLEMRRISRCK